ncbi:MAG: IS200/IS605 family transposase [Microcoleaceae cyanobacterium]
MSLSQLYRHDLKSSFLLRYHFIWHVRRRSKVLQGTVVLRLKELTQEICDTLEVEILKLDVRINHVHAFLSCPPNLSPHQIMHRIKGHTAHQLRREFEHLLTLPSLWTRSYLVSTEEQISRETIREYLQSQSKRN